jgi:hypothetical protein
MFATQRRAIMTDYVWELGIDWNAVETAGVSYLRGGLVKKIGGELDVPLPGTAPVRSGDTITFRIFDVGSSAPPETQGKWVDTIDSFGVLTKAAVKLQLAGNPLSNLQPPITKDTTVPKSQCFPPENKENVYASWTAQAVNVSVASGRFLLTVQLQATGSDGSVRIFRHDPEMVVGPNA